MKTEYVKLSEARKQLKEWDCIPTSSIRKALNCKPPRIHHVVSGFGKRASKLVKVADLKKYFESLKR